VNVLGLHLERRARPSAGAQAIALGAALLGALACTAILIATAGASFPEAVKAFLDGAFGDRVAIGETLVQATPLIYTGLAVVVAFRARVWNIGGEGQFLAGAMGTYWITHVVPDLPGPAAVLAVVAAAAVSGALWALVPAILKVRFNANEVVVTVMMNFVILNLLSYLLGGPWRDPESFYLQTALLPEAAFFPRLLEPSRLHLGFIIAVVAAVVLYVTLRRTTFGYEIRAVGGGENAARHRGISITAVVVAVMLVSGALAGLGGGAEIAGLQHRLRLDVSTGYGFSGIVIALLARLNPLGVIVAAVAFGALVNGSTAIQIQTGVPTALVTAIQGLTLILVLMSDVLTRYRIARPARA
jgi:ABC-type uncharacterized transport system permease subunit